MNDTDLPMDSYQPARRQAAAPWRAWFGWLAAFLLIGAGWALVAPLDQVPDEADHVYRAAAVVRGEIFPHIVTYDHGTGAITNVPVSLMRPAYPGPCGRFPRASCSFASAPPGQVTVVTGEGRMFPFYYALVGWPSLLSAGRTGWYLMRLDNAVLCALMLATAAVVVMSLPRRPLVLAAALLVGLTPDALSLTGAVNSSALEAAAAVCYWAVLLALIHDNSALSRRLLASVAVAATVVLTLTREYDWLWAALAMVLVLATAGREQRRSFLRSPRGARHAPRHRRVGGRDRALVVPVQGLPGLPHVPEAAEPGRGAAPQRGDGTDPAPGDSWVPLLGHDPAPGCGGGVLGPRRGRGGGDRLRPEPAGGPARDCGAWRSSLAYRSR